MNLSEKQAAIQQIDDEVGVLHGVLNTILPKLPNVKAVDYTHGNREMGADFVITVENTQLAREKHIALVVKAKKISQDFSDVQTQIKQSLYPKRVQGGKKSVRVSEVWVITSKTISNNAKESIEEEYRSQAIEFIDFNTITGWVDKYYPEFWNKLPPGLATYLRSASQKIEESIISAQIAGLESDQYIPPKFQSGSFRETRMVKFDEEFKKSNCLFIEGDLGSGKSTFIKRLFLQHASDSSLLKHKLFPIYIKFTEFILLHQSSIKAMQEKLIPAEVKKELGEIGDIKFIYLIDGLDESGDSYDVIRGIIGDTLKSIQTGDRLIFASRPICDFDEMDIPGVRQIKIADLHPTEVIKYIRECCKGVVSDASLKDLYRTGMIKEIATTPIAANMLKNIVLTRKSEIPSSLTELYSKYIELVLGRWEIEKGLRDQQEYDVAFIVLRELSNICFSQNRESVSMAEFTDAFKEYLKDRPFGIDASKLAEKVIERSNLLYLDQETSNISFRHRSFMEYFFASHAFQTQSFEINEDAFSTRYATAYFFYLGLKKDAPEFLSKLAELRPSEEIIRWNKIRNFGLFLLAAYHTKIDISAKALSKIFIEFGEFHVSVRNNQTESPFNEIPPVGLVGFMGFQSLARYDYAHLKPSLRKAKEIISLTDMDQDTKIYAEYLISVAIDGFGGILELENFATKYSSVLPLEMKFYLGATENKNMLKSDVLKSIGKRVMESMSNNPARKSLIDKYFSEPINNTQNTLPKQQIVRGKLLKKNKS